MWMRDAALWKVTAGVLFVTLRAQTPQWIPAFAHSAWLSSWHLSPAGQVRSDPLSNASRATPEPVFCASRYPKTVWKKSANRAAAAAWLARCASVSRAGSTPADAAPGWLVNISPARRNLCRLCWRDGGSVSMPPINGSRPDRHLQLMNFQVSVVRIVRFTRTFQFQLPQNR